MPPSIALLMCTAFVFVMLRFDRKQSPQVSFAMWLPTIAALLMATKGLGYWFGVQGTDDISGSPLDRIVLSGMLCIGLALLVNRGFNWSDAVRNYPWLFMLIGYMFVSILWSDIPYTSLKRWVREIIVVVMAFLTLTERDSRQAVESILRRMVYVLIPFSLLLIRYYPEHGVVFGRWEGERMWVGLTLQKNGLGRLCTVSALYLCWVLIMRWREKRPSVSKYQTYGEILILLITLWLLKGPPAVYPATATVALFLGLAMLLGLFWMNKRQARPSAKLVLLVFSLIITLGIVTPIVGGRTVASFASTLGRSENLTGRTDIWAKLFSAADSHPFGGYGFGGFWTPETQEETFGIKEAHNGYLDVYLALGILGLALNVTFWLSCCCNAYSILSYDHYWGALCICFLLMAGIHNVTESTLDLFSRQMTMVVVFLLISGSRHKL